mgnify:CR=1 FL=1
MKKFVLLIFISILLKSTSVFANERLAECSALNNNLNHKYGSQLLDKGETFVLIPIPIIKNCFFL